MTSARSTPEHIVRKRTPIPQRPTDDDIRGIVGEISRQRGLDRELEIVLQHMVQAVFARFGPIWDALEILDKRFQEFEDGVTDTEFREVRRKTQRRERTVVDDDSEIEIDVLDVITTEIVMRGNRTGNRYIFYWQEPMPV